MRLIFQAIEAWETAAAQGLDLPWTDRKLGLVRQKALEMFLPLFRQAYLAGPEEAVAFYARAYGKALVEVGLERAVPAPEES